MAAGWDRAHQKDGDMITEISDAIDPLAGIAPGSPWAAIRDGRMVARQNAQNSFAAQKRGQIFIFIRGSCLHHTHAYVERFF